MENLDSLIISLLDSEANKGMFKNELSEILSIPVENIYDPMLKSELVNGVVKQYLYVGIDEKVSVKNLDKVDFDFYDDGYIVFDVGDSIL